MNIEALAREAGDDWDSTQQRDKDFLAKFAALYREALITALAAGSGEPVAYIHRQGNHWEVAERPLFDDEKGRGWTEEPLYTADQLAGAVLRERERCCDVLLNKCHDDMTREEEAAAIRSGE